MTSRLVLGVVVAALAWAAPAVAAERVVERGIVQSVDSTAVVLRALDGTEVTVALGPQTRYRLNGRAVRRGRIRVGLVAEAVTSGNGPALVLRAFGQAVPLVRTGRLVAVRAQAIVLRLRGGARMRIPLGARTAVRRAGDSLPLTALGRGQRARVRLAADGSARLVTILR